MGDRTGIEWCDATWNPTVGCDVVSPGCTNCYAMGQAARIEAMSEGLGRPTHYAGTTRRVNGKAVWTGKLRLAPDHILYQPQRWTRPRKIFVNSMSDLFHERMPIGWIDSAFAVMGACPQHTFLVLTKRSRIMREYVNGLPERRANFACHSGLDWLPWPLPNVWLGVSAEDQARADERIPDLLATPAAVRFVSAEPLLGPTDFGRWLVRGDAGLQAIDPLASTLLGMAEQEGTAWVRPALDWIIVGGESGPLARPMHPDWARSIRDQCAAAGVPFFFKQWGGWAPITGPKHVIESSLPVAWPDGTVRPGSAQERGGPGIDLHPVGKKRAGRLLDGVEHNGMPEANECNAL